MNEGGPREGHPRDQGWDVGTSLEGLQANAPVRGAAELPDASDRGVGHVALFYRDREAQLATLVPFLKRGLEQGERCLCIVDRLSTEAVCDALRTAGVDVDATRAEGALEFGTTEATYLQGGTFDPEETIAYFEAAVDAATAEFAGLRVTAETGWLRDAGPETKEEFMTYEATVNDRLADLDCIAMCQYQRDGLDPAILRDVVHSHPHLICDGTVCQNVYYTPPGEFFGSERVPREVDRMLGTLVERATSRVTLQERERTLRELSEITTDRETAFEAKIERLLDLGCRRFGLERGSLVKVHRDETVEIEASVGPSGTGDRTGIPPVQPGAGRFCRRAIELDRPIGVADVREVGWDEDALHREWGVRSYLGLAVTDGDGVYGTVAFVDSAARDRAFSDAEYTILELMGQWVSTELGGQRRKARLAACNEMGRELERAETRAEITRRTVAHAEGDLRLPVTAILTYDADRGALEPSAQTARAEDELPTALHSERPDGALWEAFVAGEVRHVNVADGTGTDLAAILAVPVGQQGLLAVGTGRETFSQTTREFVEATAATVEAAYTRADRERQLHQREATLADQNERLTRLGRINDIIRNIDQALVAASSRDEIEAVVCQQLAGTGPYELAWVGAYDPVAGTVQRKQCAGARDGLRHGPTVSTRTDPAMGGPISRAAETRAVQFVNDVVADRTVDPWRQSALDEGYHACICLPLVYGETLYGVLMICADQPDVFDDLERTVLSEMADTVAYACNAVESKKAIVSDEVTKVTFDLESTELATVSAARRVGCSVTLESLVPAGGGDVRAFLTAAGVAPETAREVVSSLPLSDVRRVAADPDGPSSLFVGTSTDDCLFARALEHGGRPRDLTIDGDEATVTIELASDAAVREFVEMLQRALPGVEPLAQQTTERPQRTPFECFGGLVETLTARQFEALQLAHQGGYLEEPRRQRATDLAHAMDISQPTFNSHLRAAQRKLCEQLFDER